MTGFGKGEYTEDGTCVTVEVSSVNGRFFDLKTKMPKSLGEFEADLRAVVQEYIDRGRVSVSVYIDRPGLKAEGISIDNDVVAKYVALARSLADGFGIDNTLDMRTILTLPDVIIREDNGIDPECSWEIVKKGLYSALDAHKTMREREGRSIGDDMKNRLSAICGIVEEIGGLAPRAVESNRERLRKKIDNFVVDENFNEARFTMEIALYADRVDITEELVRLKSHCEQYSRELNTKKTSGRKLSFLLQEMNREVNTIASKASDAEISQLVVKIKEELERMREQAENME